MKVYVIIIFILAALLFLSSSRESFDCAQGACSKWCAAGVKCCGFECNNDVCGCDPSSTTKEQCDSKYGTGHWCGSESPTPDSKECVAENTKKSTKNVDNTYTCICKPDWSGPRCGVKKIPAPRPAPRPDFPCCNKGTGKGCRKSDKVCESLEKPGYFSIRFDLNGFKPIPGIIYIRVQKPIDPNNPLAGTNFYKFPLGVDTPTLVTSTTIGNGTDLVPAEFSRVVAPNETLYFPPDLFISGRMYVSIGKPVNTLEPSVILSSNEPMFSTVEFTVDDRELLWINISGVDEVSMPSLKLANNRTGAWSGYENAFRCNDSQSASCDPAGKGCCSLYDCMYRKMKAVAGTGFESTWKNLFVSGRAIMAPKQVSEMNGYFLDYAKRTWLPAIQRGGGFWARFDGPIKFVTVSADLKNYVIDGVSIPTRMDTADDITSYWSGGKQRWAGVDDPTVKVLSTLLMSGISPEWICNHTSRDNPWSKTLATSPAAKAQMYRSRGTALGLADMPMWNLYEQLMHDCGFCAYAYDYDDFLGRDGTAQVCVGSKCGASKPACLSLAIQTDLY
jgi:hypothetical protein